ncbi:MAG: hypothetical protein Q3M24_06615 [Candidatus Electrothrix aestuarii]|uniref:DUF2489 domain-containing protein n=1 Tax=Candidatus Electrothrix aestuarii TaxID=3062594 RepID=A0AAU8LZV0_9BACT|nr:hypothetical protein [Candidatus Electrothrix aestuarii]
MNAYISIIAAVLAGIFTVITAYIAWKLKNVTDERARNLAIDKEQHDEKKKLYESVYTLFEQAIREIQLREEFTLTREFSDINAKIHLFAPEVIGEQYSKAHHLLEEWSILHHKASPRQMEVGERTITIIEAPDPTEQYKKPAMESFDELQEQLQKLIKLMRQDLNTD